MASDLSDLAAATSNPDRAHASLRRLVELYPAGVEELGDEGLGRLAIVAAVSDPFVDGVARHERMRRVLVGPLDPASAEQVKHGCLRAIAAAKEIPSALAVEQRAGLLRIAVRDLMGLASTAEVAAELADLAQGVLGAAADIVLDETGARIAVVAMGKTGGRELNYVSDVDVLFVGDDDWSAATRELRRSCA